MLKQNNFHVLPEGPPQDIKPSPLIYQAMGEAAIFKMLEDFYVELGHSSIKHLFPQNLIEASKKSAAFFVFILGGPPLFQERYGPPMMRKRHLAFIIDEPARQVWLDCFKKILINADKKYQFPMEHFEGFWTFLDRFSLWMVNTQVK